jgi:hypothetical protein
MLDPGKSALHIHYRGPAISEPGEVPAGGAASFYLFEAEEYQDEAA